MIEVCLFGEAIVLLRCFLRWTTLIGHHRLFQVRIHAIVYNQYEVGQICGICSSMGFSSRKTSFGPLVSGHS